MYTGAEKVDCLGSEGEQWGSNMDEEVQNNTKEVVPNTNKNAEAIVCEDMDENLLDRIVHSEAEAYRMYCEYGIKIGFSVRKSKQTYVIGTRNIRTKDYVCSNQGFNEDKPSENRTGCQAMIRFTVDPQGKWTATHFVKEHNHPLAPLGDRYQLRSARSLTRPRIILEAMVNSRIPVVRSNSYMAKRDSCSEILGFIKKDLYNFITTQRGSESLDIGDYQSLINYFSCKGNECGMFYWDAQINQEGWMINFFWRDARSKIDYDCFGDVIVFDASCKTTNYNLVCAPFLCINHHWQNVTCGCAILMDETTASFEWLFSTFVESMGSAPKTIFTNQSQAMSEAIEKVLPDTCHCICLWDILKNASSYLGELNSDQGFSQLFNKCMTMCDSEEEFNETWAIMTKKYNVEKHEWLSNLYKSRKMWSTTFSKGTFDGGIKLPQRSESIATVLHGIANKYTSLIHFVNAFDNMTSKWRKNEADEELRCHQIPPAIAIKHSSILKQASSIYTHKLYKLFESEYLDGVGATDLQETSCGGTVSHFDIMMQEGDDKVKVVTLDMSTMKVNCTCGNFETLGILCSHAWAALRSKNVTIIPDQYILKRWTKNVKLKLYSFDACDLKSLSPNEFRKQAMWRACYLITIGEGDEGARQIVLDVFDKAHESLEEYFKNMSLDGHSMVENNESTGEDGETPILDPPCVRFENEGESISKKRKWQRSTCQ